MQKDEIIIYQTEDKSISLEVRIEDDTVWLTQAQMAELLQTTPQNITLHIKNIYKEKELEMISTCKDFLQVQIENKREVRRKTKHYNLWFNRRFFRRKEFSLTARSLMPGN
jgi:hypothetical protein